MPKFFKFAFAGAIALAAAVACNTKEQVSDNPNFNPETKEVTTQFVLSVNTGSPQTKMTSTNVQMADNFLGIQDAYILAYKTTISNPDAFTNEPFVLDPTKKCDRRYPMGKLYSNGSIDAPTNASASSNRILQMSIPVDVDAMLVYGKAINDRSDPSTDGIDKARGYMTFNIDDTPDNIYFELKSRLTSKTKYDNTAALMIFVINRIIKSQIADIASYSVGVENYANLTAITWKSLGDQYKADKTQLNSLEEILGAAFANFTTIKDDEYRAGSSTAILTMVKDMYTAISGVASAIPTSPGEANARRLAEEIVNRIDRYFDTTNWAYKSKATIQSNVPADVMTSATFESTFADAGNLNTFPYEEFHIPEGAAQLAYNSTANEFSYKDPNVALVQPNYDANNQFDPLRYKYPAELAYYVNSPLRVTANDVTTNSYPNGTSNWKDDANAKWAGWTKNGRVQSDTRGVAVRDNINYGVALLKTSVAYTAAELQDNKHNLTGDTDNNKFTTATGGTARFTLHGVLVGGQNSKMNWQYLRKESTGDASLFNNVIYDDAINSTAIPTPTGSENYTIVFDNYNFTDTQSSVYVALELKNEGDPFWGKNNLIPHNGIFYLVGELQVAPGGQTITWPDDHQVPPIYVTGDAIPTGKAAGYSKEIPRVFIQDFVTKAVFNIGELSLQKAYVTIPNLASTQMSLGLSVDLSWTDGYEYSITF
jgi:hypothetical protein